jgi:hypothetical protein
MAKGRARVGTGLDTQRLGQALARPGMDPRVWVTLAYANGESAVDAPEGVFVDVTLSPSGQVVCARVGTGYAGNSFGAYGKIHKDDELVVVIPNGDPAEGAVVVARLWSQADPPPSDAIVEVDEVVLDIEADKPYRLRTSGSGKIEVDAESKITLKSDDTIILDCDKVRLGKEAAVEQLVMGSTYRSEETILDTDLALRFSQIAAAFTAIQAAMVAYNAAMLPATDKLLIPPAGKAIGIATTTMVTAVNAACVTGNSAGLAAQTAINTFELKAAQYLSSISKTK